MDPRTLVWLSSIWHWNKLDPNDIGPLGVLLPVGLYGVYMAVFLLAVWTMFRDGKRFSGVRWVVVLTFAVATLYILALLVSVPMEVETSLPLIRFRYVLGAWCSMSPCICCSLSDSVLAWRCYVIFGKRCWLKWTLTVVVLGITVSGILSGILGLLRNLTQLDGPAQYSAQFSAYFNKIYDLVDHSAFPTTLTWAVCSLLLNTVLSTSIIAKIIIVSRQTRRHFASSLSIPLARAFIESSSLSWIALAVYTGLYTACHFLLYPRSVGPSQGQDTLEAILPLIFSISQALVIARLGISRFAASTSFKDTIVALTSDGHDNMAPRSLAVAGRDAET